MLTADDRDGLLTIYIRDARIVVAVTVDCLSLFNKFFSSEFLGSAAGRATKLGKVAVWALLERTMIAANDRDFGSCICVVLR